MTRLLFLILCIALSAVPCIFGAEQDLATLLEGVGCISAPGVPGPLCVFGDDAFVVVTGGVNERVQAPVVAAARLGRGRVVAFGHDGYFTIKGLNSADTGRFMLNVLRWVSKNHAAPKVGVYKRPELLAFFQSKGVQAEAASQELGWYNVLCVNPVSLSDPQEFEAITAFVRKGGGLIAVGLGWGWLQLNPGKNLRTDHPGNKLLASAGIVWGDGCLKPTAGDGYVVGYSIPRFAHAARALDALIRNERLGKEDLAQAVWVVTQAARVLPPDDKSLLPRLRRLQKEHTHEAVPTPDKPLTIERPLARLALTLQIEEMKELPVDRIRAHPAAASFPGAVPADAPTVTRTVQVDTNVPGWHSTGLYALPGKVIEVRVPKAAAVLKGLMVRIGAHSDLLWDKDTWKRCPEICRHDAITAPVTRTASAFGGPIYIEVPPACRLGNVSVEIAGGIEAPHYVLGKTSLEQWRSQIRHLPAPWAELESTKVILTIPATAVRKLDNPKEVMEFWDRVLDACAELACRPLKRERPERYVTDVQISAGYMHSGYPIMTHLDMAQVVVDKTYMMTNIHGGVWGLFHEMGHNHQSPDWTFEGAGEVTVNLFTLYVFDKVCGKPPRQLRNFDEQARAKIIRKYLDAGASFEQWKKEPFTALIMYIQLQEAFGWEAYKRVFAEYHSLPPRPITDDEKRDQWMVRFSRAVGKNLGPFFTAWGVPLSEKARSAVAKLPTWMPKDFPPGR